MQLKAVIYIGANVIYMALAEVDAKGVRIVESLEQPTLIGNDVFAYGSIGNTAINAAITTIKGYLKLLKEYNINPKNIKVYAGGAIRDADNADTFLDRVAVLTKLVVKIPEPSEITKITYSLLQPYLNSLKCKPGNLLLVLHVGPDDTELMGLKNGQVEFANLFRFGTLRIKSEIIQTADPALSLQPQLTAGFEKSLYRVTGPVAGFKNISLVLLGHEARFVAGRLGHTNLRECVKIQARSLNKILRELTDLTPQNYAGRYNLSLSETENMLSSLYITCRFMEELQLRTAWVCPINFWDGLLMENTQKPLRLAMDTQTLGSAWRILADYNNDTDHAKSVLALSKTIYKAMQKQHGLNGKQRLLLEVAAILHDAGTYVSHHAHHKHSAYLIENSDIFGLTAGQQILAAQVARYHRRALPQPGHKPYDNLPGKEKNIVNKLAAILRVADALDNSHGDLLRNAEAYVKNDTLFIKHPNTVYAAGEALSLGRKKDLFLKVFGMDVKLV